MFDSKLTQMLTACIFGLSTLISSHQVRSALCVRSDSSCTVTSPLLPRPGGVLDGAWLLCCVCCVHKIYNVQNRIQEDNLQHLALFTEYGRVAHALLMQQLRKHQSR